MTTPPPLPAPGHLVVRLPNPAGDVVAATPALRALRRALPTTRISWSGRLAALALLDGLPDRDAVIPVAGPLATPILGPRRLGRTWASAGADAVLLLTNGRRDALAAHASRAPVRVGYVLRPRPAWVPSALGDALAPVAREAILSDALAPARERGRIRPEPMRTWYLRLAARFGAVDDGRAAALAVTAEGEAAASRRLETARVAGPFFAVSPGARFGPSKAMPVPAVAEVVRGVRAATGLVPLLLGASDEAATLAELAAQVGAPCLSTADAPARWPETKALLARASLLLATDAGPRHVATALGTPVVVWMGPTDPRWSEGGGGGGGGRVEVVRREDLGCLGCHLKACPIGHPCLSGLEPRRVVEAALRTLAAVPRRVDSPFP